MSTNAETVIDVVLMVDAFSDLDHPPKPLPKHFEQDVEIVDDLFLSPMQEIKRDLLESCEPRGINWDPPSIAYPVNYVLGRRDAPDPFFSFDPDRRLHTCVQLSRLVRPTSLGYDRAGRIRLGADNEFLGFAPSRISGASGRGWVADPQENWLRDEDVQPLRELLEAFDPDGLPERVLQAMWHHEHAHQIGYVDVRWPLMTTGLESLVHTDRYHSTRQFVDRLLAVQAQLGLALAEEQLLRDLYDRRSSVAHGQRLGDLDPATRAQYLTLEELLRTLLRRAILDDGFAAHFADSDAVRKSWPI